MWCQALILEMELSRKRMAEVEAAFDRYAFEIIRIIGRTEYDKSLDKYFNIAIQRGCHYCYPNAS